MKKGGGIERACAAVIESLRFCTPALVVSLIVGASIGNGALIGGSVLGITAVGGVVRAAKGPPR